MKILIMGLSGSGKTHLAKLLSKELNATWFNADEVRKKHNDWDFSEEGRIRQAIRMNLLAINSISNYVICDFIAPTEKIRSIFNADFTIWMNTISKSNFTDTDNIFESPTNYDYMIENYNYKIKDLIAKIRNKND